MLPRGCFNDREDAGRQLAQVLRSIPLVNPLVLAIPRGGIEVAAPIARALGAELDVILARKLRDPIQPELALGAVTESGEVYLCRDPSGRPPQIDREYLESERDFQSAEIARRTRLFRSVRPRSTLTGRSVIVVDDGIATGSTMIAALRAVRAERPRELIAAVPVASPDRLHAVRPSCDRLLCLLESEEFFAVGQFYKYFEAVSDDRVVELLRHGPSHPGQHSASVRSPSKGGQA